MLLQALTSGGLRYKAPRRSSLLLRAERKGSTLSDFDSSKFIVILAGHTTTYKIFLTWMEARAFIVDAILEHTKAKDTLSNRHYRLKTMSLSHRLEDPIRWSYATDTDSTLAEHIDGMFEREDRIMLSTSDLVNDLNIKAIRYWTRPAPFQPLVPGSDPTANFLRSKSGPK